MENFTADYGEALNEPLSGLSTSIDHLVCGGKVMMDWNIIILIIVITLLVVCFFRDRPPKKCNLDVLEL